MKLKVTEIFKSVQGEGLEMGVPSVFVRLSGCNLNCAWCDTRYAWEEGGYVDVDEIVRRVREFWAENVVITGGEPLLQTAGLEELVSRLRERITIETNGTIEPSEYLKEVVDVWAISPKLSNCGKRVEYDLSWIKELEGKRYLKFVILDPYSDVEEAKDFVEFHGLQDEEIVLQPDGREEDYVGAVRKLFEYVRDTGCRFRVMLQLHRLCFGMRRGV